MTSNLKLDDAMEILEDLLNSSKSSMVIDTIRNIQTFSAKDNGSLE